MKSRRWLRNIKDHDWVHYAALGLFFTSLSILGILSATGDQEREVVGVEAGIRFALIVIGLLSFLVLVEAI